MKTKALFLILTLAAISGFAQSTPPDVISRPANRSDATGTNTLSDRYSLKEIDSQLRELHRTVADTLPMLSAVTESGTNAVAGAQPSTGGGWAGILEGILNRDTNQVSQGSTGSTNAGSTNLLGQILRGVLGTNATASASGSSSTLTDLVALRDELRKIMPILDHLNANPLSTSQVAQPTDRSSTNNLIPTSRR
ncbi:MAG: hypothetical protein ACTHKU_12000 [Verrucomicrobiota bacterium]